MKLSEDESRPLAESVQELSRHFDIPVIDPKWLAIAGFCMTAGRVYAPKAMLIKMELAERKAKARESAKVFTFPGAPAPLESA